MQPIPASDPIIPIISEPNDEEKSQGAKTPPAQSTIFTLVYAAENTVPYPNSQQAEKERDRHLSKQSGKQHIDGSDDQIKQQERDRRQERKTLGITSVQDFTDEVKKIKNAQTKSRSTFTNSSNPTQFSQSTIHTDSDESEIVGSLSSADEDLSSELEEDLDKLHEHLSAWENDLKKSQTDLITKTRAKANKEEIEQWQKEVDSLQTDIAQLKQILRITARSLENKQNIDGQQETSTPQSPPRLNEGSVQQMLLRTKAGRRRPDDSKEEEQATPDSGGTSLPQKLSNASSDKNSALFSRSDLDILFTKEAKKTLGTMNEKIQAVAESLDTLLAQRSQINKKNAGPESDVQILQIEQKITKQVLKLVRLINRVSLIEELASPHHELLSAKKKKEKYDEIVQRGFKYEVQHGLKIHETPDVGF